MTKADEKNITPADDTRRLAEHWRKRSEEYRRQGRTAEAATAERLAKQYDREPSRAQRR